MIISVSRRTDIPAFYARWFINRVRAGYCAVANPFNAKQIARVSLLPEDVDLFVFWTRQPRPMMQCLDELDQRGYRYYFQVTLLDNPRALDPQTPALAQAIRNFQDLAARIGSAKTIWRYDPIVFTTTTDARWHIETFTRIARALRGYTNRVVISIADEYAASRRRLEALRASGLEPLGAEFYRREEFAECLCALARAANENGMTIQSCAEEMDLQSYGIAPGKCVDADYIHETFGIEVTRVKDPSQRAACGCVISKDIGAYDTCLFECQYCYATTSFARAHNRHQRHDPDAPSLI
ncbi:MAG: DUF1848 domain-containing protein [Chloroflexi bacterium]|nr:DUF1848 domain-containing protein [Chloroflexota bacterium]